MPNIKSAHKRMRQSAKRAEKNAMIKSRLKTQFKKVETLITEKKTDDAKKELSAYFKLTDKAAGKGIVKKNSSARRKSKLSKKLNALSK